MPSSTPPTSYPARLFGGRVRRRPAGSGGGGHSSSSPDCIIRVELNVSGGDHRHIIPAGYGGGIAEGLSMATCRRRLQPRWWANSPRRLATVDVPTRLLAAGESQSAAFLATVDAQRRRSAGSGLRRLLPPRPPRGAGPARHLRSSGARRAVRRNGRLPPNSADARVPAAGDRRRAAQRSSVTSGFGNCPVPPTPIPICWWHRELMAVNWNPRKWPECWSRSQSW